MTDLHGALTEDPAQRRMVDDALVPRSTAARWLGVPRRVVLSRTIAGELSPDGYTAVRDRAELAFSEGTLRRVTGEQGTITWRLIVSGYGVAAPDWTSNYLVVVPRDGSTSVTITLQTGFPLLMIASAVLSALLWGGLAWPSPIYELLGVGVIAGLLYVLRNALIRAARARVTQAVRSLDTIADVVREHVKSGIERP